MKYLLRKYQSLLNLQSLRQPSRRKTKDRRGRRSQVAHISIKMWCDIMDTFFHQNYTQYLETNLLF